MEPDTTSAAYQAGHQLGQMIVPILMAILFLVAGVFFVIALIKSLTRKTRGWIISTIIAGMLALVGLVGGLGFLVSKGMEAAKISREGGGEKKLLTGKSGDFTLEIPSNWKEMPQLSSKDEAQIGVGNGVREVYALVIQESRTDYKADLQTYDNQVLKNMSSKLETPEVSDVEIRTINGLPARQHRMAGTVDHLSIVYYMATIETPESYYQILTWTMPSKEVAAKPVLEEVINSFKATAHPGAALPEKATHGAVKPQDSTESRVRKITANLLDLDPTIIKQESTFKDLGADNLDTVELVMAIEEEFDLEIPDEEAQKMKTIGEFIHWIDQHKSKVTR